MTQVRREYRVGVVGYRRGKALAHLCREVAGSRLVAVADLLPERLEQARQEFDGVACYPDDETGERPTSSGEDGRLALETILAFHFSSDAGAKPVKLPVLAAARSRRLAIH